MYVNATTGLFKCQKGCVEGNFSQFKEMFSPPDPIQELYTYFHEQSIRRLLADQDAMDYLFKRGFTEESLTQFRYGYADKRLYDKVLKRFSKDELLEAKLWFRSDEKDYPYFTNHIIIPFMRAGKYVTFQGRHLDPDAKMRYMFLRGIDPSLYHAEDLNKRGQVWLTEGAFKRDRVVQEGQCAVAIPGASQYKRYLAELRRCENLWICMDTDANEAGQKAALEIAKALPSCMIVTLPLEAGQEKIGVDDFIEQYGIESLLKIPGDHYENGVKQKPTSLLTIVSQWRERVENAEQSGYDTGHERLDSWLGGFHNGTLTFVAGSPHAGKSIWLEDSALRLYKRHENLLVDYYTNDDSLFTTITRLIAKIGRLQPKEVRYAGNAFRDRPDEMRRYEAAANKLAAKSDRLKILDRSYNVSLERLREQLIRWRHENPEGEKVVFIDAFTKTMTNRDMELKDEMSRAIYKSSLLKEISQEAHIPVVCTHELPKLGAHRPNPWNLRGSNTLEYDADIILLCYQEAHIKGIDRTSIKIEYGDAPPSPVLEISIGKDKIAGTPRLTDLFEVDKQTFGFKELPDSMYWAMLNKVKESERAEYSQ